ncbi:MAG TPA: FG-GAP-like repeat-containing protein, partial [bacterium]|nr:FG-GAP-like repeat-containing protein [bacterium]
MKHFVVCLLAVAFFLLAVSCGDESAQKTTASGTLSVWEEQRDEPLYGMEEATQEAWFATVQKRLATGEYRIAAAGEGFRATNRAQGLRFFAAGAGFTLEPREGKVPAIELRTLRVTQGDISIGMNGEAATLGKCMDAARVGGDGECLRRLDRRSGGVTEWFDNTEGGIEQGFDIARPLSENGGALTVELQIVAGNAQGSGGKVTLLSSGAAVASLHSLFVVDAKGTKREGTITAQGNAILLIIDAAGLSYPLTIDPLYSGTPDRTLEVDQASAAFGSPVASAGDVNGDGYGDVIIGASMYDNGQSNEGVAFVYHGSATGISTTYARLLEANNGATYFGSSVAGAGDVNSDGYGDVIVGAPYYTNGQTEEGAVFIYHGSASGIGTGYNQLLEVNQANAHFGMDVSGAGDVNGDGYGDIIIGAREYDGGQVNEGAAYIYHGSKDGIVAAAARTLEPTNQTEAYFGFSVAGAGDVNGDGYSDVVIGARNYQSGAAHTDEGAIYIYHGSSSGIGTAAARMIEPDQASAYLGDSVAGAGDVNGDGYSDIIAGAPGYDNGQTDEGVAFIYHGSSTGIGTASNATLQADQADAQFGISVAGAGDTNGDGYADVVVGANYYDFGQTNEGRAFLYHGSATGISTTAAVTVESDQAGAQLGGSVAGAGDVNGDGFSDIIVGASSYYNGQTDEGAAFVYHGSASGIGTDYHQLLEGDQADASFGYSVSNAGDVNGDGYDDVIVGASLYDNVETDEGAAFIYHGSATGIGAAYARMLESNQNTANFGSSVASAGDVNGDGYGDIVVGASDYSNGQTQEGVVFVYHGSATGIGTSYNAMLEADLGGDDFGASVAGAGDVNGDGYGDIIVGAPYYANGNTNEGAIYIYHGSSGGINTTYARRIESNLAGTELGGSVASAGDVNGDGYSDVIAGASSYSNGQTDEGAAFIYHGSATGIGTTHNRLLESNQASANMGNVVSGAGDVNGDGYSDVVIGAYNYDNPDTDEGIVYIYHGSASGIVTPYAIRLEQNEANIRFGWSVSGAGDVNGDGYADIVVGTPWYDNTQTNEGAIYIYHGSSSGIVGTHARRLEPLNQMGAFFGYSVSGAGDVNGDGYSDVITGAEWYDHGQSDEGTAFVYLGSNGGGVRMTGQQKKGTTTVSPQGKIGDDETLTLSVFARSFMGRSKAKMLYEVKAHGTPFNNTGFQRTGAWTDTTLAGTTLSTGIDLSKALYHWRVRYQFMDGSMSRWFVFDRSAGVYTPDLRVLKGRGESCSAWGECGSGFCADGFCCDQACGGSDDSDCQACSAVKGANANGACTVISSAYTCRGSGGICDIVEKCDGTNIACPADGFKGNTEKCRDAAGVCDAEEYCTSTGPLCPPDGKLSTPCRGSAGECDVAENCDGNS